MQKELYHFKYLRKYRSSSGKWQYVYDDRKIEKVADDRAKETWTKAKDVGAKFISDFLKSVGRSAEKFITSGSNYGKNRRYK